MATAEPLIASVWIDAPPDRVFPFFTDPARLTQWLGEAADLQATPGGRFAVDIGDRPVRGSYVEVDEPHRVVFTWGDAGSQALPPGASRVEVDIAASAGGSTVTLTHHDLPEPERSDHARGWPIKLESLRNTVG